MLWLNLQCASNSNRINACSSAGNNAIYDVLYKIFTDRVSREGKAILAKKQIWILNLQLKIITGQAKIT